MRLVNAAVVLGAMAVVLVGCSTGERGNPTAVTTTTTSAGTTTSGTASDRPKQVKLDGLDACKALSANDQKQLGTSAANPSKSELIDGVESTTCRYITAAGVSPRFSYNVDLVTGKGYDHWKSSGNLDVSATKVAGFPAKQVTFKGTSTLECSVAVDVADGQHLFVQFLPTGRDVPQDTMCQNAAKGAELALTTLQTLK